MTPQEIEWMMNDIKAQAETTQEDFTEWFWFGLKEKLAGGDILRFKEVGKQNFKQCLNLLSYWHRRDIDYKKEIERKREQDNLNTLSNF